MDGDERQPRSVEAADLAAAPESGLAAATASHDLVEVRVRGETVGAVVPASLLPRVRRMQRVWAEGDAAVPRVRAAFADVDPAEIERHLDERDDDDPPDDPARPRSV